MGMITDTLPKPQVQASQFPLHISYFLQNCKKWQDHCGPAFEDPGSG